MSSEQLVYRLLFDAMLEMRQRAHDSGDSVVFHLADLFHNTVLQFESAAIGNGTFDDILLDLRARADEQGCEEWVDEHIQTLEAKHADPKPISKP